MKNFPPCPLQTREHGPAILSLSKAFRKYENFPIRAPMSTEKALEPFSQEERYVLQMTWATYGRLTSWALCELSQWDFPGDFDSKDIVKKEDMKKVFDTYPLVQRMRNNQSAEEASRELEF